MSGKDQASPIIIKKKKGHGHGHHGGAWKVAYADFVTAMMAFFLLLWLLGSTTPEEQRYISGYFKDPGGFDIGKGGTSPGVIPMENAIDRPTPSGQIDHEFSFRPGSRDSQGGMSSDELRPESMPKQEEAETSTEKNKDDKKKSKDKDKDASGKLNIDAKGARDALAKIELQTLTELKDKMEKAIASEQVFKDLKDQLLIDVVESGLRIHIIDKDNRPSFDSGSANPKPYTEDVLRALAAIIQTVPNRVSVTGHTDAKPFHDNDYYSNWELSADRANAARRALLDGGLDPKKVARVEGLADTVLLDAKHPEDAMNRRISIIVLKKDADDTIIKDSSGIEGADVLKKKELPPEFRKASDEPPTLDDGEWEETNQRKFVE
jgi:chemotaxis protein MotB